MQKKNIKSVWPLYKAINNNIKLERIHHKYILSTDLYLLYIKTICLAKTKHVYQFVSTDAKIFSN